MKLWFLLGAVFLIQEPISTGVVLLEAYQSHYNVWLIHLIFAAATIVDIAVTYYGGMHLKKRFGTGRFAGLEKHLDSFSRFIGKKGKIFALIVYSPIIFPASGIWAAWADIPFMQALVCMFIGEVVFWYSFEWFIVLGAKTFVSNAQIALYVILAVTLAISVGMKYFTDKKER